MIESLKEAFDEVAQLPEDEQRHIVEMIRKQIASDVIQYWYGDRACRNEEN